MTNIIYDGVIDTKTAKDGGFNLNTYSSGSFVQNNNSQVDSINYSKFEIQKKFEPFYKPSSNENNRSFQKFSMRNSQTPLESNRKKVTSSNENYLLYIKATNTSFRII